MLLAGLAAAISCPAEVTLVRMSNDAAQPLAQRRNYSSVANAFTRIVAEEGPSAFFRGVGPFVNRAMLVGAVQVGTYDQFRETFRDAGVQSEALRVFYASMSSGLIYSIVTMPFERCARVSPVLGLGARLCWKIYSSLCTSFPSAKNRMAFSKPDPVTGVNKYRGTLQTIGAIASREGITKLWSGFPP